MNDSRRKRIKEAITKLDDAQNMLSEVRDEEQEAFDNLPENMQGGEKGEKMEGEISSLTDAIDSAEQAVNSLESIE